MLTLCYLNMYRKKLLMHYIICDFRVNTVKIVALKVKTMDFDLIYGEIIKKLSFKVCVLFFII